MSWYTWYQRFHWRLFNLMVRLFGIATVTVAIVFAVWAAYLALWPGAASNVESSGLPVSLMYLAIAGFAAVVGISVLRAESYRPDLGDRAWTITTRLRDSDSASQRVRRTWWTGEPLTTRDNRN